MVAVGQFRVEDRSSLGMLVDVDGVLTDQDAQPDLAAINLLAEVVRHGVLAALVTGRSRGWLEEHILPHLRHNLPSRPETGLNLWSAAEYGAVQAAGLFAPWRRVERFAVPFELRGALRSLVTLPDRSEYIEWDESKECMATVEARHGDSADNAHRELTQTALDDYLGDARRLAVPRGLNVLRATYAVDVAPEGLTKHVGAAWALEQFSGTDAGLDAVLVFGDSSGDLDMARAAQEVGISKVQFVWLGAGPPPRLPGASVIRPSAAFAVGTREALATLLMI